MKLLLGYGSLTIVVDGLNHLEYLEDCVGRSPFHSDTNTSVSCPRCWHSLRIRPKSTERSLLGEYTHKTIAIFIVPMVLSFNTP